MITLRPAVRSDCPGIVAIYNEAVLNSTASYDYEPQRLAQREAWFTDHQRGGYPMFVAVDEAGRIVGWSALSRYHGRVGFRFTVENAVYVAAAWVFVAFRAAHSAVHCTFNRVMVRFSCYLAASLALWFMLLRAVLDLLR